jgi:hypothetical protein
MSPATAQCPPRFVRRTRLNENEYRVNFKQIDNDVIKTLISSEAKETTPQMSAIYLGLLSAPRDCWEREGVLHFVGETRDERHLTAWEQMREIAGVANSTLAKALCWMHQQGIIGYDARANGIGIRIFFNRASSSIRCKPAQKNLRLVPTPTGSAPTPRVGMGFMESFPEKIRENIEVRAFAREENLLPEKTSPGAGTDRAVAEPIWQIAGSSSLALDARFTAALTRQIAIDLRPEIAATVKRENENTREWFLNHGLPKATRVAQRETYDLLRAHGVLAKKGPGSGEVGRSNSNAEQGREGKPQEQGIAGFLAETGAVIHRAAAAIDASASPALRDALLAAAGELEKLGLQINAGDSAGAGMAEMKLATIEERISSALWMDVDANEREVLLKSARRELQDYAGRMEEKVFEEAVRGRIKAMLCERYGVPRLNFFYAVA